MIITSREYAEGARIPFWWGVSYLSWESDRAICYPIPLNLLIRWSRDLYYWIKATRRFGWRDNQVIDAYARGEDAGKIEGYTLGVKDGRNQILYLIEEKLNGKV